MRMAALKIEPVALAAVFLLAFAGLLAQGPAQTVSASHGSSCEPHPAAFSVPEGRRAAAFRIVSLEAGKPCTGEGEPLSGFSIRRGEETVFVHYLGRDESVSDPLPLEDLSLGPGRYVLLAAPARGAAVTLSFELRNAR